MQISFWFWTNWNSIWLKNKWKTVITIIFHSIWKKIQIYFWECSNQRRSAHLHGYLDKASSLCFSRYLHMCQFTSITITSLSLYFNLLIHIHLFDCNSSSKLTHLHRYIFLSNKLTTSISYSFFFQIKNTLSHRIFF